MCDVFLIASGMLKSKRWNNILAKRHYYLNYGLLGLATALFNYGLNSKVIHGLFKSPEEIISRLRNLGFNGTNLPVQYLTKASELLKTASKLGIWAKVNVLLYPGESRETLDETITWLNKRKEQIKGVSVGPVIVYGIQNDIESIMGEFRQLGASPTKPKDGDPEGVTRLNLSPEICADAADELSLQISRKFMSAKNYFDLKSFSYFSRNYKYTDFIADAKESDPKSLNFAIDV